jgi:hypothetical protein
MGDDTKAYTFNQRRYLGRNGETVNPMRENLASDFDFRRVAFLFLGFYWLIFSESLYFFISSFRLFFLFWLVVWNMEVSL